MYRRKCRLLYQKEDVLVMAVLTIESERLIAREKEQVIAEGGVVVNNLKKISWGLCKVAFGEERSITIVYFPTPIY